MNEPRTDDHGVGVEGVNWTSEAVGCADGPAVVSLMSHVGVLFSQQKIFLLLYVTLYDTL